MTILRDLFSKHVLAFSVIGSLLYSCGTGTEADKEQLLDASDTIKSAVLNVAGELFSVPSPIQTAMLIQKSGIAYDHSILSSTNKVNTFSTDYSRALNLGVYGADLGYVSLYSQTQDALGYLAAIKSLSDKLGLSAAFDAATMERIKNNITNKDSMMVLVGLAYRGSDAYLKDNQRTEVGSLILAGGWLESMHFSSMAYRNKPSDPIRYRIAEQKQALTSILKILGSSTSGEVIELTAGLKDLAKIYEGISFKYNFIEPVHDSTKKITYINSTTEVIVTDEQLTQIVEKVKIIRAKIVNSEKS
ncbi:MAG: hypothetical protein PSX36_08400 [bacterium]|nr:hypothetical protein [bacterium]